MMLNYILYEKEVMHSSNQHQSMNLICEIGLTLIFLPKPSMMFSILSFQMFKSLHSQQQHSQPELVYLPVHWEQIPSSLSLPTSNGRQTTNGMIPNFPCHLAIL